jgi:hypothetical protein
MQLIIFYVGFVLLGELASVAIARSVEVWSKSASLPVFLVCFFLVFAIAWKLAVKLTEPKTV